MARVRSGAQANPRGTADEFFTEATLATLNSVLVSLSEVPLRVSHRSGTLDSRRLQRVIAYIHANLTNEITVEELAAAAALSRFHFSRIFKATTGQSPSRFIGQLRLDLAKSLLVEGRSIAGIAYDCGFSSESNFARSFRRVTGLTPAQHRNLARNSG